LPVLLSTAISLRESRKFAHAEALARQAVSIAPDNPKALSLLGQILHDRNNLVEAELIQRRAFELAPENSAYALRLGALLLSEDNWERGLPLWERRHGPDLKNVHGSAPRVRFRQWAGESLRGKSLLIWPEQGHGDQIQMVRYVQRLRGRGAARITLVTYPALLPLFASTHGVDAVLTPEMYYAFGAAKHDFWVFIFSIPFCLRETPDLIPKNIPYIKANKNLVARWQSVLRDDATKVGIAWKGSEHNPRNATRSLAAITDLAPLSRISGASFVTVQDGATEDELKQFANHARINDLGSGIQNFAELAAIISSLDVVITVDTSVAHLAGALGKPTWILLPNVAMDWRWGNRGADSIWYPGTVTLFRQQQEEEDWSATVNRVAHALRELSEQRLQLRHAAAQ
jgi:hypothetical protein